MKQLVSRILVVLMALVPLTAWGHEGEDHGAAKPTVAKSGMTTQLAKTDAVEVLLKYPKLVGGRETKLVLFVTDFKTNAPQDRLSFSLKPILEKNAGGPIPVRETSTPGMYEALITPAMAGKLGITAHLTGPSLNETVTFSGITVASDLPAATQPTNLLTLILIGFSLLTLAIGVWLWLRRRPADRQLSPASGD